jgi:hypothetical protein
MHATRRRCRFSGVRPRGAPLRPPPSAPPAAPPASSLPPGSRGGATPGSRLSQTASQLNARAAQTQHGAHAVLKTARLRRRAWGTKHRTAELGHEGGLVSLRQIQGLLRQALRCGNDSSHAPCSASAQTPRVAITHVCLFPWRAHSKTLATDQGAESIDTLRLAASAPAAAVIAPAARRSAAAAAAPGGTRP